MRRKEVGIQGEKLAAEYLRGQGYHVRETNVRLRGGEIDIIAQQGDYLVFVEVRTRTGTDFGTPEESITYAKREKLISLALTYLQGIPSHSGLPSQWRIDVVAVELGQDKEASRINLIQNAVGG